MSKHTPGPWAIQSESWYSWDIGTPEKYVAEVQTGIPGEVDPDEQDLKDKAENLANANLISAAPDLLAMLEEARQTLEMWKDVAPAISLCADIDKVIARVRGES